MSFIASIRMAARRILTPQSDDAPEEDWKPPGLLVTEEVCRETRRGLRSHSPSHEDHEGVVYWAGQSLPDESTRVALTVIVPEATTSPGSYDISPVANAAVIDAIHDHDLELVATVHSHPGERTSHSELDSEAAQLPHEGYFSIVVPNYAVDGVRPYTDCGVHVYHDGDFVELEASAVEKRVETLPSAPSFIDSRDR
ncbi:Mov34/MPN/PAD-1 family protein [Haloplanus sp. C73]|uniref:Mov34/MPN/PAD-1 family protein n=1 Tax=Haloplanus sp. C73 TaxID=3421641 RepID=UPI003EBC2150